eukprot:3474875-Rhodomonas_salina.1
MLTNNVAVCWCCWHAPQIKDKKPHFQDKLYQERGFLELSLQCRKSLSMILRRVSITWGCAAAAKAVLKQAILRSCQTSRPLSEFLTSV